MLHEVGGFYNGDTVIHRKISLISYFSVSLITFNDYSGVPLQKVSTTMNALPAIAVSLTLILTAYGSAKLYEMSQNDDISQTE